MRDLLEDKRSLEALLMESGDLAKLLEAVLGETVSAVRYVVPRGAEWPDGHSEDRVHEVDMAVELVMVGGGGLVLSWAMDGLDEALAIEFGDPDFKSPGDAVDVSAHVDWSGFLGEAIVKVTPSWHVPNEGCVEMPWAFRFEFSNSASLMVALGEVKGAELTYMPDALLVIFDPSRHVSTTT